MGLREKCGCKRNEFGMLRQAAVKRFIGWEKSKKTKEKVLEYMSEALVICDNKRDRCVCVCGNGCH